MMSDLNPSTERLRQIFRSYVNPLLLALYRLGCGYWFRFFPRLTGNVMILTHIGRKSGKKYYQPLNFAYTADGLDCVAAFGDISDWVRNISIQPEVDVWTPKGVWKGTVELVQDSPDRLDRIRGVLIGSGFAAFTFGLNPYRMTDDDLDAETKNYQLIRVRPLKETHPSKHPGDLGWVWQIGLLGLLGIMLLRRRW